MKLSVEDVMKRLSPPKAVLDKVASAIRVIITVFVVSGGVKVPYFVIEAKGEHHPSPGVSRHRRDRDEHRAAA